MIDNTLIYLLEKTERGDSSIEAVANTLRDNAYLDIMAWYGKYTEDASLNKYLGCAQLLLFLHKNEDVNFMRVEAFENVLSFLYSRFNIKKEWFFSFSDDYHKLLYGVNPG